jgi:aminopeptidase YwaD
MFKKQLGFRLLIFCLIFCNCIFAQYVQLAKPILDTLCSPTLAGRGYVKDGVNKTAKYLESKFAEYGLRKFDNDYFQHYTLDINTFPSAMQCIADGRALQAGEHYLVSPDCPTVKGKFNLLPFDIKNEVDKKLLFLKLESGTQANEAILLKNAEDSKATKKFIDSLHSLHFHLPLIVTSSTKKLLWSTSTEVGNTPILIFPDTIINTVHELELNIENKFIKNYACKNVIGYVPSTKRKNKGYIVFTAHYDHLGMMGTNAYFPGASDNASGVSMLLNIAKYYSKHQPDYPVIFMLFSGEEVGLLGSKYFVDNAMFNLKNIRALVNIDIMGSAEAGITVVNGEVYKNIFDKLVSINKKNNYLPEVKIRGKAANSDHYHFGEAGVPSIFIYANGGPGYYHDVWDKPATLTTTNYDNVAKLLIKFADEY